ncbi:endochitinase [Xylariaceae sp. FL0594]|nr:endochitinase [Xylariaceae sp. FL0594]
MVSFKTIASAFAAATLVVASPVAQMAERANLTSSFQNVVYFTQWSIYPRNYHAFNLPASQISQVVYAFANFLSNGTVVSSDTFADLEKHYDTDSWQDFGTNAYGSVKQLYILKKANRQLKVLLSIGGWTYSPNFPAVASTDSKRQTFASSAVTLIKDWGFDGIDIDWEWPANDTDAENMVALLKAIRDALDAYSKEFAKNYHFLLSVALPAGPDNIKKMRLSEMNQYIDQFNMLAYDYAGSFTTTASHQANLYPDTTNPKDTPFSTDAAIKAYLAAGIPAKKITLGLPLYGRDFLNTAGLGQPYSGVGEGSWDRGVYDYKVLPLNDELYDSVANASYSYNKETKELVSYDNVYSVQQKVKYIQDNGLGGTMFWEASADRNDTRSLIAAAYNAQGGAGSLDKTNNLLSYPNSTYDNIRNNLNQTLGSPSNISRRGHRYSPAYLPTK